MGITPFRNFQPESPEVANSRDRLQLTSDVLFPFILEHASFLDQFGQLELLEETSFIRWATEREIQVSTGILQTDVEKFWLRGWFRADRVSRRHLKSYFRDDGKPVSGLNCQLGSSHGRAGRWHRYDFCLHPFRFYPLMRLLDLMEWRLTRASILYPSGVKRYAGDYSRQFQRHRRGPHFIEQLNWWNGIADLAILLEPLYWPQMTRHTSGRSMIAAREKPLGSTAKRLKKYSASVLETTARIPKARLAHAHMELRHEAARIDDNHELYLLLRCSSWQRRERVRDALGGAMWLRHTAEVLRHAYDELYEDRLVHEDEAFGTWASGAREWLYGSEYPLDDERELVRRTLPRWGLTTAPRVRFYVEGDTEEGALTDGLQGLIGVGVEIVNLKAKGWRLWLRDQLKADKKARRFSFIMVDGDREDVLRSIRRHAREDLIVGMVFVNRPDLESHAFSIGQLVDAANRVEKSRDLQFDKLLSQSDFDQCRNARDFDECYRTLRGTASIKGADWGQALMRVAWASRAGSNDEEHVLVRAVMCAMRGVTSDYDAQRLRARVDPDTLTGVDTGAPLFGDGS